MERIRAYIHLLDWTEGYVYGMSFELAGTNPTVKMHWGDGTSDTYRGNDLYTSHVYNGKEPEAFCVEAEINCDYIIYVCPTGGDCYHDFVDMSGAPSAREIYMEDFEKVLLDNPACEELTLRIMLGDEYDLSRCPNVKWLKFDAGWKFKRLDLSNMHNLEHFETLAYCSPEFNNLILANDAPLKYIDISGHHLRQGCLDAIHRIIERNGGEIVGEFEPEPEEDDSDWWKDS